MTIDNRLAADVLAARQAGIIGEPESFLWPVSDEEFNALGHGVVDAYAEALQGIGDQPARDVLQADFGFVSMIIQIAHALRVRRRCADAGVELLVGPLSRQYYQPDWAALAGAFDTIPRAKDIAQAVVRDLGRDTLLNQGIAGAARAVAAPDALCLGSRSGLRAEYIRRHRLACRHINIIRLLSRSTAVPPAVPAIEAAVDSVCRRAEADGVLDSPTALAVAGTWKQRLRRLSAHRDAIAAYSCPPKVLLNEVARPLHRLAALTFRRKGARVVGFHHGNDVANAWEITSGFSEYAHCSEFVCPTQEMARFHAMEHQLSAAGTLWPVEFVGLGSDCYRVIHDRTRQTPPPPAIKRIAVMGYPLNAMRYLFSSADFHAFQGDVERRLGQVIRSCGVEAIYKAHPERLAEAQAAMKGAFGGFQTERFEKIWDQFDAFVFGCSTSTTFGFALLTPRPIILLDVQGRNWNPEAYELLKRRCRLVPAWFDSRNRLQFDVAQMEEALRRPVGEIDFSYVEKFMLPTPGVSIG